MSVIGLLMLCHLTLKRMLRYKSIAFRLANDSGSYLVTSRCDQAVRSHMKNFTENTFKQVRYLAGKEK